MRCPRLFYTRFSCSACCFAFHSAYSRCRPRLRATEGSFKSGLESGRGGGSPQQRPQSPRQRPKPRCRSEAAFRRLCTPARHTPYRPRLLIEPSHINCPPLSAQPVSILQGHGHPDGRGRGQSSGSVRPDWEPGWAAASFFHTAPGPPWAFCPGTYKCR